MGDTLEDRVRRLEDVAFEGGDLTRSIDRLGLNASALGEALLQVDRQQQMLTKLGTEISVVSETSATKDDLAATKAQQELVTQEFRKNTLRRIYTSGALLTLLLVATLALIQVHAASTKAARKVICETSARTASMVQLFADQQIAIEKANRFVDAPTRAARVASLETFRSAFPTPPCLREFHK